ncbi:TetR/AcrR family transcriptional regulator [Nonomuraea sp. SMC257]|uniref:TetR/AcrR family transcriptional regulator n=1 Tax=Nonomuraea montanisoli TaxID=2741721 RepID=A0A7Y6M3A5_9ACTN|nr:TetR/AcrR family transcriptional regulator [Nonomuraea montanisoli]NUW33017.1 TetR/AcrR family transcriptional regulator [Nonomuraea montanisoli]
MARSEAEDPRRGMELLWPETATATATATDADGGARRGARQGLDLDRIVRAAVELADAEGLAGLSMRKVADRLGFTTMSLYRHVPGRDQLVDLMRDAVLAELAEPPGTHDGGRDGGCGEDRSEGRGGERGEGWRGRLEAFARQGWELRRRHPWLAEARGVRHLPGPNAVAHYERMLAAVAGTGLSPSEVLAVVNLVGKFVDAEALQLVEAAEAERRSGVSDEEWWGARQSLFERFERYPTITRLWEEGGYDHPEDSFAFGLARLLDGVELLVRRRSATDARDETRDETSVCRMCGTPVERPASGRPRAYCSPACRQRAYRERRAAETP